jgi:hypothetical protein
MVKKALVESRHSGWVTMTINGKKVRFGIEVTRAGFLYLVYKLEDDTKCYSFIRLNKDGRISRIGRLFPNRCLRLDYRGRVMIEAQNERVVPDIPRFVLDSNTMEDS